MNTGFYCSPVLLALVTLTQQVQGTLLVDNAGGGSSKVDNLTNWIIFFVKFKIFLIFFLSLF